MVLIGVAADSGCGKSTFMRRLTNIFGGESVGPLGGGFPESWETNTLVSDRTTVICLDDFHLNDRAGRKVTMLTALDARENNFDLMYEQLSALKAGKTIQKPIYNHVNGTLDTPETIEPTPIVIVEGLHPMYDERVRELLDFSLYLDISDDVKFAWKIQRDMEERGHSLESIKASIEVKSFSVSVPRELCLVCCGVYFFRAVIEVSPVECLFVCLFVPAALSFANLLTEQVAHSVTNQDCDCFPSLNALTDLSVYLSMLCICLSIQ